MAKTHAIVPVERIASRIVLIRGQKVMLDADLAEIYRVSTKRLNEQVKRNRGRFPEDFMFQLSPEEAKALRSQFATSKRGRGGRRYRPYAFTEHGTVMLASVLNSSVAVQASIQVVRAFVRLREILSTHRELAHKLAKLEKQYDKQFKVVFDAIRELMAPPRRATRRIGFHKEA
jgi:phage regulator Rha-like protein